MTIIEIKTEIYTRATVRQFVKNSLLDSLVLFLLQFRAAFEIFSSSICSTFPLRLPALSCFSLDVREPRRDTKHANKNQASDQQLGRLANGTREARDTCGTPTSPHGGDWRRKSRGKSLGERSKDALQADFSFLAFSAVARRFRFSRTFTHTRANTHALTLPPVRSYFPSSSIFPTSSTTYFPFAASQLFLAPDRLSNWGSSSFHALLD